MSRNAFLTKLHIEGVLQLVSPSVEMKAAYRKKAETHLVSARLLFDNDLFEQSVSMAYYSMYYSVMALFFATGIKCENHTAAIILLGEIFERENSEIENAKRERIDKQYYVTNAPVREDVIALIQTAESFNADIYDFTDRLTSRDIEMFRRKFTTRI